MKQILIVIIAIFVSMTLMGCQQEDANEISTFRIDKIPKQITIQKEVVLGAGTQTSDYKPLVITGENEIKELVAKLKEIEFRVSNVIYDLAGYDYVIEWEENTISIINERSFYFNDPNTVYELKSGNFSFLENYEFEEDADN